MASPTSPTGMASSIPDLISSSSFSSSSSAFASSTTTASSSPLLLTKQAVNSISPTSNPTTIIHSPSTISQVSPALSVALASSAFPALTDSRPQLKNVVQNRVSFYEQQQQQQQQQQIESISPSGRRSPKVLENSTSPYTAMTLEIFPQYQQAKLPSALLSPNSPSLIVLKESLLGPADGSPTASISSETEVQQIPANLARTTASTSSVLKPSWSPTRSLSLSAGNNNNGDGRSSSSSSVPSPATLVLSDTLPATAPATAAATASTTTPTPPLQNTTTTVRDGQDSCPVQETALVDQESIPSNNNNVVVVVVQETLVPTLATSTLFTTASSAAPTASQSARLGSDFPSTAIPEKTNSTIVPTATYLGPELVVNVQNASPPLGPTATSATLQDTTTITNIHHSHDDNSTRSPTSPLPAPAPPKRRQSTSALLHAAIPLLAPKIITTNSQPTPSLPFNNNYSVNNPSSSATTSGHLTVMTQGYSLSTPSSPSGKSSSAGAKFSQGWKKLRKTLNTNSSSLQPTSPGVHNSNSNNSGNKEKSGKKIMDSIGHLMTSPARLGNSNSNGNNTNQFKLAVSPSSLPSNSEPVLPLTPSSATTPSKFYLTLSGLNDLESSSSTLGGGNYGETLGGLFENEVLSSGINTITATETILATSTILEPMRLKEKELMSLDFPAKMIATPLPLPLTSTSTTSQLSSYSSTLPLTTVTSSSTTTTTTTETAPPFSSTLSILLSLAETDASIQEGVVLTSSPTEVKVVKAWHQHQEYEAETVIVQDQEQKEEQEQQRQQQQDPIVDVEQMILEEPQQHPLIVLPKIVDNHDSNSATVEELVSEETTPILANTNSRLPSRMPSSSSIESRRALNESKERLCLSQLFVPPGEEDEEEDEEMEEDLSQSQEMKSEGDQSGREGELVSSVLRERHDNVFKVSLEQSLQLASAMYDNGKRIPLSLYYVTEELRARFMNEDGLLITDNDPVLAMTETLFTEENKSVDKMIDGNDDEVFERLIQVFDNRPFGQDVDLSRFPRAATKTTKSIKSTEVDTATTSTDNINESQAELCTEPNDREDEAVSSEKLSLVILRYLTDLQHPLISLDILIAFETVTKLDSSDSDVWKTKSLALLIQLLSPDALNLLQFLVEFVDRIMIRPARERISRLENRLAMEKQQQLEESKIKKENESKDKELAAELENNDGHDAEQELKEEQEQAPTDSPVLTPCQGTELELEQQQVALKVRLERLSILFARACINSRNATAAIGTEVQEEVKEENQMCEEQEDEESAAPGQSLLEVAMMATGTTSMVSDNAEEEETELEEETGLITNNSAMMRKMSASHVVLPTLISDTNDPPSDVSAFAQQFFTLLLKYRLDIFGPTTFSPTPLPTPLGSPMLGPQTFGSNETMHEAFLRSKLPGRLSLDKNGQYFDLGQPLDSGVDASTPEEVPPPPRVLYFTVDHDAQNAYYEHMDNLKRFGGNHQRQPSAMSITSVTAETESVMAVVNMKGDESDHQSRRSKAARRSSNVYQKSPADISKLESNGGQVELLNVSTERIELQDGEIEADKRLKAQRVVGAKSAEENVIQLRSTDFLQEPLDPQQEKLDIEMAEHDILQSAETNKFLVSNLQGLFPSSLVTVIPTEILPSIRTDDSQKPVLPAKFVEQEQLRDEYPLPPLPPIPSDHVETDEESCVCSLCKSTVPSAIPVMTKSEHEMAQLSSQCESKDKHINELLMTVQSLQSQVNVLNAKLLFLHDHHTARPMRRRPLVAEEKSQQLERYSRVSLSLGRASMQLPRGKDAYSSADDEFGRGDGSNLPSRAKSMGHFSVPGNANWIAMRQQQLQQEHLADQRMKQHFYQQQLDHQQQQLRSQQQQQQQLHQQNQQAAQNNNNNNSRPKHNSSLPENRKLANGSTNGTTPELHAFPEGHEPMHPPAQYHSNHRIQRHQEQQLHPHHHQQQQHNQLSNMELYPPQQHLDDDTISYLQLGEAVDQVPREIPPHDFSDADAESLRHRNMPGRRKYSNVSSTYPHFPRGNQSSTVHQMPIDEEDENDEDNLIFGQDGDEIEEHSTNHESRVRMALHLRNHQAIDSDIGAIVIGSRSGVGYGIEDDDDLEEDLDSNVDLEDDVDALEEIDHETEKVGEDIEDEYYYSDAYKTMDQQLYRNPILPQVPAPKPMSSDQYKKHHRLSLPIQNLLLMSSKKRMSLGNALNRWKSGGGR